MVMKLWQAAGFSLATLGGTLLHFLYDWTNQSVLVAPVSGVNESTWEHIKLFFFPALAFGIIQSFFFKTNEYFWQIKLYGILVGIIAIPVIFYVYNGAIGKSPDCLNISIFYIECQVKRWYNHIVNKNWQVIAMIKILQYGEGNFLRTFVDAYFDTLNKNGVGRYEVNIVKPITFGSLERFKKQGNK